MVRVGHLPHFQESSQGILCFDRKRDKKFESSETYALSSPAMQEVLNEHKQREFPNF